MIARAIKIIYTSKQSTIFNRNFNEPKVFLKMTDVAALYSQRVIRARRRTRPTCAATIEISDRDRLMILN